MPMTTIEIARLLDARETSNGWASKCPAHDDRAPSLAIGRGRDGRTLLRCFAGCATGAIVNALGLTLADLFPEAPKRAVYLRPRTLTLRRAPTGDQVEGALRDALAQVIGVESEALGFQVATLVRHQNEVRRVIERRLGVRLTPETTPWHEIEPFALDPLWRLCVDRALEIVARRAALGAETLASAIPDMPKTQERVLRLARRLLRASVKDAARSLACAA